MSGCVVVGDQVRILRGRWCNHTALVEAETETSVKVAFSGGIRWYARSEVEREGTQPIGGNADVVG